MSIHDAPAAPVAERPTSAAPSGPTPAQILDLQRAAFLRDGIPDLATRLDRLGRLHALLADNCESIADAIIADFGSRARWLCTAGDVMYTVNEIRDQRRHLKKWLTEPARTPLRLTGFHYRVRREPLGVVGIAGPWNFPVQLTFVPAAGALAAGNRLMIRPSSVTRHTGDALARYAAGYFDLEELAVITAEHGPGSAFSRLRFDSFFFTGSPEVGIEVAKDCAANLVPATLELGGKNPVVVDTDADIARAAKRIAAARLINSGQVCLSPDYVFVPEAALDQFTDQVLATWRQAYPTIVGNPEYTAIINSSNYDRIVGHLRDAERKGATVTQAIPAGEILPDAGSRLIPPTLITGLRPEMTIDSDEVFGPVLSVHPYRTLDDVIATITSREHPLTLYWHGPENDRLQALIDGTRSGSVNINDFMVNMYSAAVPFGGVGRSGMGSYHGEHSIKTFTHARTVAASRLPVGAELATPKRLRTIAPLAGRLSRLTIPRYTRSTDPRTGI
ncbi:aldehyde dehydrogenase family protein [Jongsikchunia kroppenstedtii]|uniref:aldehyde dehydrogenase family protein n=1 Tax=Jongsikchunia kroppenstedtii TaxID=1121721 RepID=UPI0003664E17|nr:aldehyde dehydrogenase family protein [Jongsikchunia kroppenstedtii]